MSDAERDTTLGGEAPWRRWQMGELRTPRRESDAASSAEDDARQASQREARRQQEAFDALREQAHRVAYEEGLRQGREAGHAEGLAQGLEDGRRQAEQELERRLEETVSPLLPLAQHFGEAIEALDGAVADDLVELALATGRQLAGEALKARPRQVLELVRALLHTEPPLVGQQRLWLHPLDHRLVTKTLGEELEAAGWTLQPDDQLSRGGCRVTSASGELDATWETRWQAIQDQVRKRRPARQGETDA
ncbi:flagellar assembly protein FliH [Halomonas nitroreducens]|uniref:Flagellar assembly protein FliH n=1 Tax=Halomonas nitroreducens TaxID=447425 RepID=A0A3S0KR94_9GAMM|nr:flagellar assembly protein FliH [Halomonas nitroreducens]RTR04403.1 flagellar assembly protein FliH [Halomonas nitroreducens]